MVVVLVAAAMWVVARLTFTAEWAFWARTGLSLLLLLAGAWMTLAGVLEFRRASTTVNPMSPGEASTVVDSGIYARTRNPMYLGFLFALLAWAAWLAAPWSLLGPVVYWAWMTRFQILPEERALNEHFGEDFSDYCRRVGRWM